MAERKFSRSARPRGHAGGNRPRTHPPGKSKPPQLAPPPRCNANHALEQQLDDTRSILTVAIRCLDNLDDHRRLDVPVTCGSEDVATVLRVGIARLDVAREALQAGVVEDRP